MSLFKNEVGRPSNETLKKRKIVIASIIAVIILLIGGVSFFVVRRLGNIDGSSKNAVAGKFTVTQQEKNCYKVEAPLNEKYWAVHVYYKDPSTGYFQKALIKKYFDYNNNSKTVAKNTKVCFARIVNVDTYRILVRVNQGTNHKLKGSPSSWKPNGYLVNNAIGWAYKDYKVNWNNVTNDKYNSGPTLTLIENSPTVYNKESVATVKFKHNDNGNLYYKFTNYNYSTAGYKQNCSVIKKGETKNIGLSVGKNNRARSTVITLYSDSSCTKKLDQKKSKTYTFNASTVSTPAKPTTLKVTGPNTYIYTSNQRVTLKYSYNGDSSVMFYRLNTFANGKLNYANNCSTIKRGQDQTFTLDISNKLNNRYAVVYLYSDGACKNMVKSVTTDLYKYIKAPAKTEQFSTTYLQLSEPAKKCYTSKTSPTVQYQNRTGTVAYYTFITRGSYSGRRKNLYVQPCSQIGSFETKRFTLTVDRKAYYEHRYADVYLYADSSCKTLLGHKTTSIYSISNKC